MTTHPAPTDPRPAFGYADYARQRDARSTLFVAADRFTADHAGLARQTGADIGLLWVLGQTRPPITEGVGPGALEPWARELNLPRQYDELVGTVGRDLPIKMVQTEQKIWEPDWDSTFRTLAGSGLDLDTSFGPSDRTQYGYLFGTGMPFYPLDRRGRLLPLLEAPFVLGGAGITVERLEELFEESRSAYHQPLTIDVGADAMAREPSAGILHGISRLHEMARDHDHWLTTVTDYVRFLSARRQSVITSQWSEDRRLTVSARLVGTELAGLDEPAVPAVAVPAHHDGRSIDRIEVDDPDLTVDDPPRSGPGDERLVDLPPGRHVLSVYYHSSDDEGEDDDEP